VGRFQGPVLGRWAKGLELPETAPIADIVAAAVTRGRAGGPVFAVRQQWPSFPLLNEILATWQSEPTERARLEGALGPLRYVHLVRDDKLDQGISYIRARQTGIWHRNADGSVYEKLSPTGDEGFDAAAIRAQMAEFASYDAQWRAWFAAEKITPFVITYRALADAPIQTLRDVLAFLGLDPAKAERVTVPTARLADAVNEDWVARMRGLERMAPQQEAP